MRDISPGVWLRRHSRKTWHASPPLLLALALLGLIVVGAVTLKLPWSHLGELSWLQALFTAASAVCVTGLSVIDVGSQLTTIGQWVLIVLIQLGGLGIMTFAALTLILLGGRLGLGYQRLVNDAMNQTQPQDVKWLIKRIGLFVLVAESIGVLLLAVSWVPEMGWQKGLFFSIFHAVSAFNNAGFSLWADSFQRSVGDGSVVIVISALIIAGGLGFTVVTECWHWRWRRKLSLHSKLTLVGTLALLVIGAVLLTCIEWNNADTLGQLSLGAKLWAGWLQSVTARTAGFSSIDLTQLCNASLVVLILLMFIGAGTNSTGGGIKVSTMMTLLLTTRSFLTGRDKPVVFSRSIGLHVVFKALAVSLVSLMTVVLGVFLLSLTDPDQAFKAELFEVVSALSTTGLSLDLTPKLSSAGQTLLILLMFIGRIGPLTLAFLLTRRKPSRISYAEGEVYIG